MTIKWPRKIARIGIMQLSQPTLQERRKRARWRAWHRGMQEMDIMLGRFADAYVPDMDDAALDAFEALLQIEDVDLYDWTVKGEPVPDERMSPMLQRLLDFQVVPQ